MKKILLLCAAMALVASSAFAVGVDLTVGACQGAAGFSSDAGTLDCAGGQTLALLGVFQPNEALPDLAGIDVTFDLGTGDIGTDTFWDITNVNSAALNSSQARPTTGCTAYTAPWGVAGSGTAVGGVTFGPNHQRANALCYRPSALAVTANQKLWGIQLLIDCSTSAEAIAAGGGSGGPTGCTHPVSFTLNQIIPRTVSGNDGTPLVGPSLGTQTTIANGGTPPVPTHKHTWGQLKSLYR